MKWQHMLILIDNTIFMAKTSEVGPRIEEVKYYNGRRLKT